MRWNGKETDSVDFTGVNEYSLFKITTSNIMRNSQKALKWTLYLYPWTKQHNVNHRNETATSHNIDKTDETEQIQDDKGEEWHRQRVYWRWVTREIYITINNINTIREINTGK